MDSSTTYVPVVRVVYSSDDVSTWVSHRALSIDDRVHEGRAFKSATGANSSELSLRGRVPFSTGIQIRVSAGTTFAVGRNS